MKPILSLDIDGVLADETRHLAETSALYDKLRRPALGYLPWGEFLMTRHEMSGWWMDRPPLWQPTEAEVPEYTAALSTFEVQLVSKRPPSMEATSLVWLAKHYPWIAPHVRATFFLDRKYGHLKAAEVPVERRPAVAIDDSTSQIQGYLDAGIPVVIVPSEVTLLSRFPGVPVVANVGAAIVMAKEIACR